MADVSFNIANPYQQQQEELSRRQKMAEILQQQSFQPMERTSYAGIEAPISPYAGLAKMLQAYTGAKGQRKVAEERMALGERYRADQSADFTNFAKMLTAPAVAGSAAVPERFAELPTTPFDDEGNPMPGVSAAPAIPAVASRRAGQIDPEMIGQFKTPETQQMAMAQLLAQIGPEKLTEVGKGGSLYSPRQGKVVFTAPTEKEFGTTPQYEKDDTSPTGYVAVLYGKNGERKVVGPANPMNQFTTGSVDAQAKLAQDRAISDRNFNQLSANQQAQLKNEGARLGISAEQLFFDTGVRAGGAAMPPATGPSYLPVPTAAGAAPSAPGMPQTAQPAPGVAPVRAAPRIGMAPARAAQPTVAFAPNAVGPTGQAVQSNQPNVVQTAAGPVQLSGKERQKLAGATLEAQQKKEQGMSGLGETITEARQILTGTDPLTGTPGQKPLPTASGAGSLVDYLGNIGGVAPRGQNEAKRLEVIAAILTSKVPRMEGPQSDRDVELYKKAAGDAGNSGLPISTRLAALDTMQKLYGKYERLNAPAANQQTQSPQSNQRRYTVDY
jgi:hypothetical protein